MRGARTAACAGEVTLIWAWGAECGTLEGMRIVVCVKHVPDMQSERRFEGGRLVRGEDDVLNELDENAIEAAVQLKETEEDAGREAEVDFGEVYVILDGVKTKCHMFVYRLSHSGKAIHRVYPTGGQEAFLEGHIEAFHALSGIPTRHIRYDNLTSAVVQVIHGGDRLRDENERWVLFRSHYGFDAFYCQPGIDGAHEKGGVEGEVGWFRRNHLTPMPEVATLDELNDKIRAWEHDDNTRRITGHANTIGQDHHAELPHLAPLPADDFDPGLILHPRVDRSALITVRMVKYSVPAHLIGQRVRVSLRASCVVVFEGRTIVATHPRLGTRGVTRVELDHYLDVMTSQVVQPGDGRDSADG